MAISSSAGRYVGAFRLCASGSEYRSRGRGVSFGPMILSDRDIAERVRRGDLEITPLDDPELQIQPASVDLRLGSSFVVYQLPHVPFIDSRDPDAVTRYTDEIRIAEGESFVLHPGEFALGSTIERVRSEEHTSELQSRENLVCRLLLEKKKIKVDVDSANSRCTK